MWVVKNTFYEWVVHTGLQRPRAQSAPAKLAVLARASPRRLPRKHSMKMQRRRDRRQHRLDEEAALKEYAARERWALLTERFCDLAKRTALDAGLAAKHQRQKLPRLRVELPRFLFAELAALMFQRPGDILLMVKLGVLRLCDCGDENAMVQIWSAAVAMQHPVMERLIGFATDLLSMWRSSCIAILADGSGIILLRWTSAMTMSDLQQALAAQSFHGCYTLTHCGAALTQDAEGLLSSLAIGPGAIILMRKAGIVRL
jgi:hypothetical protein